MNHNQINGFLTNARFEPVDICSDHKCQLVLTNHLDPLKKALANRSAIQNRLFFGFDFLTTFSCFYFLDHLNDFFIFFEFPGLKAKLWSALLESDRLTNQFSSPFASRLVCIFFFSFRFFLIFFF